ncbi:type II toxin-antitoxin system VapC family toxin [Luteimonas sp. SJ-92]|uniref:Ribonuclease VapC n=1 Tax=Luteimonas salinisoli TaxID=2752307 RepID=A0A853JB17_9GAMM|nr:type II toxin-antitoxin system VapC family toxin [Luteimonas salinisoli]
MSAPRYLLDTNVVSDLMRHPQGPVARRMARVGLEQIALGIVVAAELRFGVTRVPGHRLAERLDLILSQVPVLPLEPPSEIHYADIRSTLEGAGTPIGPNDLLIAAQARALGAVLVTDNVREFARVPGLQLENWLTPADG